MWVVKLGGSLLRSGTLHQWLQVLVQNIETGIVVVPGGGVFADQVRLAQARTGMNDQLAHNLAMLAMEQVAWICHGLEPAITPVASLRELATAHASGQAAILLPSRFLQDANDLPENWTVTSDSIAAWFAKRLGAERLILVKSCLIDDSMNSPESLSRTGIVDNMFPVMLDGFTGSFDCWSAEHLLSLFPPTNHIKKVTRNTCTA